MAQAQDSRTHSSTVTTAWVLAAGLGTRLKPLTAERPKPLIEVCGTPLLMFSLQLLAQAGVKRVGVNSHWLHPQVPAFLTSQQAQLAALGLTVTTTFEPGVLGTGGGLLGLSQVAVAPPGERVLVANADALIDLDVQALLRTPPHELAALVLKEVPDVARYGAIGTDDGGRVTAFAGKIPPQGVVTRERMFCGWHLMDPRVLRELPAVHVNDGVATGTESGINDDGYPPLLLRGEVLRGVDHNGLFVDVGTPERLWRANIDLLSGAVVPRFLDVFGRFEQRPGRVFVHPGARIAHSATLVGPCLVDDGADVGEGATVGPGAVVGKGCVVNARAVVRRSVLLSGARADGEVVNRLCGTGCQVEFS